MQSKSLPVNPSDIEAAAKVIAPFAVRTPLLSPPVLSERLGAKVYLKPELLQRTGSFKFRGAFNKLSSIPLDARGGGVVAFSSWQSRPGRGGRRADPEDAGDHRDAERCAAVQARAHQGYGAEVVLYDRDKEDREAIARDLAGKRGATRGAALLTIRW